MGVRDVAPLRDVVDAIPILAHHRVADVGELAVLENKEICTWGVVGEMIDEFIPLLVH